MFDRLLGLPGLREKQTHDQVDVALVRMLRDQRLDPLADFRQIVRLLQRQRVDIPGVRKFAADQMDHIQRESRTGVLAPGPRHELRPDRGLMEDLPPVPAHDGGFDVIGVLGHILNHLRLLRLVLSHPPAPRASKRAPFPWRGRREPGD